MAMETPHAPPDRLTELIERVRAARAESERAEEELRAYAAEAELTDGRRRELDELLGPERPHHRRRWGAAPS